MPVVSIREITAARRLDNVRYAIRDLAVLADQLVQQGKKILYLNVGDPNIYDFQTPAHLVEAVATAMRDNKNGYAPSPGIPQAVEAIRSEAVRKGITSVQDVFVTSGASEAVDACITALVNPGENILTLRPDYPLYSAVLCKLGIEINTYDLNEEDGWQPDLVDLENKITPKTRAIVLINPNNPTGYLYSLKEMEALKNICIKHNLYLFSDEAYREFCYTGEYVSAMHLDGVKENVVMLDTISKRYSACGARIGALVTKNKSIYDAALKFAQARLSPGMVEQIAGAAAVCFSRAVGIYA